jgi:carbon storage regulator
MRKPKESIIINNDIVLTVVEVKGKTVKLGFTFPKGASVLRKELYDKISAENVSAAQSSDTAEMLEAVFHSAETDNK